MYGKCKGVQGILSAVIIILALWPNIIGAVASKWVIVVAGALILIHSFGCKACGECMPEMTDKKSSKKKRR